MGFQKTVNQTLALGVPGGLFTNAPLIADVATVYSTTALNIIGRAFTISTDAEVNPAPTTSSVVQPGGTGVFFGILANSKTYPSVGITGDPLAPSLILPNEAIGSFLQAGEVAVSLANAALIGDLVTYNQSTGELDTVSPTTTFTGVIAVTTGILTASAVVGEIYVGMPITGTSVPGGTVITALGSGTGGAGTYQTNIITAVGSTTMIGPSQPQQATSFTGVIAVTTGILTASAITAGQLYTGLAITGTGVPAGTYITGQLTGTAGAAGTYSTNITTAVSSTTMTSPAYSFVPHARVSRFASPGNSSAGGGFPTLAVISLNNGAI